MWIFENHRIQAAFLRISALRAEKYNAPYVAAPLSAIRQMLAFADVNPEDTVYDLGCGDERTVITAAKEFGARAVGIELDPLRYLWCEMLVTLLGLRGRVNIILGDFFTADLGNADVVACYIGQDANKKIQEKFKKELRRNSRIISYNFIFSELTLIKEDDEAGLYLYRI